MTSNNNQGTAKKLLLRFLIVILCCILSSSAASGVLSVAELYVDSADYVKAVIKNPVRLNYESSEPLKSEIRKTIDCILSYALDYQLNDDTKFSTSVLFNISRETEEKEKQISLVKEIVSYQIEIGSIDDDYIQNGFVVFDEQSNAHIDESKIDEYYNAQLAESIEYHKSANSDYSKISQTLKKLDGVDFAVVNKKRSEVVSNLDGVDSSNLQSIFGGRKNTIIFSQSVESGTIGDWNDYIKNYSEAQSVDFDLYISFDSMVFSENCRQIEPTYKAMKADILKNLIFSSFCLLMCLAVMIFSLRSTNIFACKTEREVLRKFFAVICCILIAAAVLIVIIEFESAMSWALSDNILKFSVDLPFAIIKLCAFVFPAYIIGLVSSFRKESH